MASVAIRIALQVVLMFRLGFPEGTGLRNFRHDLSGPQSRGFQVGYDLPRGPLLFLACVENRRTIAGSTIVTLTVQSRRIVDLEKEFQQLAVTQLLRIKNNLDSFRMCPVIAVRCISGRLRPYSPPVLRSHPDTGAADPAYPRSSHRQGSQFQSTCDFVSPVSDAWNNWR